MSVVEFTARIVNFVLIYKLLSINECGQFVLHLKGMSLPVHMHV